MAANRHDHFGAGEYVPGAAPTALARVQAEEGAPPVSPWLIEHLEGVFGGFIPAGQPSSMDDLVSLSSRHSEAVGHRAIIDYLKRLRDEQLNPQART
jgi:hypothetical protein